MINSTIFLKKVKKIVCKYFSGTFIFKRWKYAEKKRNYRSLPLSFFWFLSITHSLLFLKLSLKKCRTKYYREYFLINIHTQTFIFFLFLTCFVLLLYVYVLDYTLTKCILLSFRTQFRTFSFFLIYFSILLFTFLINIFFLLFYFIITPKIE